jgi:transposase
VIGGAHALLVIAFHMLTRQTDYNDLGADYFDRLNEHRITHSLVRRLERLGNKVILEPAIQTA